MCVRARNVPLHNVISRFARPLEKFRRIITEDVLPTYVDEEIAVIGIDTSRSLTIKGGRINKRQIESVFAAFAAVPAGLIKVVDLPDTASTRDLVGRAPLAMQTFARSGVDLLLAGHIHLGQVGNTAARYPTGNYAALVVQAGTATSTRVRGESNSFNVIRIASSRIDIERFQWLPDANAFVPVMLTRYERVARAWQKINS